MTQERCNAMNYAIHHTGVMSYIKSSTNYYDFFCITEMIST